MALYTPSESPAIVTREVDLTNGVPNVPSSTGAIVGNFRWGPCDTAVLINNEATLVNTFGNPDTVNSVDFHSATYYLRYSDDLYVTRMVSDSAGAANAYSDLDSAVTAPVIENEANFDGQLATLTTSNHVVVAKWPGELGNSLKVEMLSDSAGFNSWDYSTYFDAAPGTSEYASNKGATNDEMHVVVIDEDGEFTGTPGQILEVFPFVSSASDAKNYNGTSNYVKDVINSRSNYIWFVDFPSSVTTANTNVGTATASGKDFKFSTVISTSLSGGTDNSALGTQEYINGFANYNDVNTLLVDFLIAPGMADATSQRTVVNDLVSIAQNTRKDCVVITSPNVSAVVGNSGSESTDTITAVNGFTRSSYLVVDNNYLKVYDKYNDQYINIPAASSTAGIMAATDNNFAPWYSPAGTRRGQYFGVTSLAYSPNKSERDELYKAGINPIANIPGQGVLLYGDKTHLARPSAFDRINVRRLFLVLERAVAAAAQNVLFEFNDEFTRAEFVNIIEPLLRDVKGRRGITDFKLVCDETNNTPEIIDTNQFIATLFIKPARSINFITLNFVAVRTGVSFEEVVGAV